MRPNLYHPRRLNRLFNRKPGGWGGRSAPEDAAPLAVPYIEGLLNFEMIRLPAEACAEGWQLRHLGGQGQSGEHIAMKRTAREWMRSLGADDAEEEICGYGGRFDVYSRAMRWIVEIGNTDVGKLVQAVADDKPTRFTLIPFQRLHDGVDGPHRLIAIEFTWDAEATAIVQRAIDSPLPTMEAGR